MKIYVSYLIVKSFTLKLLVIYKAVALTGRQVTAQNNPGRCPGLRASALSGRVGDMVTINEGFNNQITNIDFHH